MLQIGDRRLLVAIRPSGEGTCFTIIPLGQQPLKPSTFKRHHYQALRFNPHGLHPAGERIDDVACEIEELCLERAGERICRSVH